MQQTISQPYFLVGAERSGTTLLRLMLNYHPKVTWCNEFEYAVDRIGQDGWPNLNKYYDWLETHRIFQDSHFEIDTSLTYPQLVNSFLYQRLIRDDKSIVGATVHRHFERLPKIWPNARYIHIIRDGRDVARSCIGMGWAGNVWCGVERWISAEKIWEEFSQQLAPEQKLEVVYEDLIVNYVDTLKRICSFLGVEYDSVMLDYVHSSDYSLPEPALIQQWKKKQTERQVQLVEYRIADMLVDRNYELSGLPAIKVNSWEKFTLNLHSWWVRQNARHKKLGTTLLLSDYTARKLGLISWQKQNTLRINDIQRRGMKKST
ncbi:sulfotransferase family protein [Leptothoe spongobia]|uniref:Sulfotransferase n=1 Tax=Leptothoe spongobia TAU-MAC 1115 TaxID=1967444 RepID=A0A947GRF9_9CYAN|nr:sulfotransferase [Leptothoe spongobia]MBT9317471.1 sulfotransferase [Leptothoe spongobia TAU-MAC 1115]